MTKRKAKGLSMFCNEVFTPGHQLKHKRTQFFMMEVEEDDTPDESNETLSANGPMSTDSLQGNCAQLSLLAMTRLPPFSCRVNEENER